ncbi:uncharacterized protein LOC109286041 [Alligator mississippiensis]|uniref:uncharacterized protein LOC109286041 n=1 Tax=Alligator mississippiensis TaxID=8496 RepID=UPI00090702EA|nr:uncharacterized protein LOC109286041 [Alligator mississippiensis]XP_059586483.1 uncharacterized protein LOC109286041 [Alligator mississippiensis]XP_059586484.1 uncharacterized protein LOC109286041 [Alligator mississippiensis]XP_059586485.1 uncharacterized protein LOC109286041 [Alligator mississippiensis]XP_059586486.1 uncharacterized protein LOC109286041 [Alligator mississippiensis]
MLASRAPSPWALPPGEAVAVVVAEATDAHGHCVLRLLFVPSGWAPHGPSVFEAEPVPLASLSSTVVAQAVVKAVITHGVDFNRVSAFLSGHAVYMCRAFSDVLQGMMPGAVHVTCNAHILSLVSDIWRMHFPDVDTLVSSLKKAFEHCPGRKLRYGEFVANQSGELQAAVPLTVEPAPVKCNSWFDAVCYHAKNIQHYQQFVRQELEITPGTQYMLKLHELLKQGDIGDKVEFVAENVTPFRELLTWFEGRQVLNHNMHNKLMDLISWVEDMASQQLSDCPTENQRRQDVFQAIAAKLKQFYKYDPSLPPRFKQPAAAFFSAVRIFDPNQVPFLTVNPQLIKSIPGWQREHSNEHAAYMNFIKECQMPLNVTEFWDSVADRFPHLYSLAKRCLTIPTSSVNAERAASTYGQVVTPPRQRASAATAGRCCVLAFDN